MVGILCVIFPLTGKVRMCVRLKGDDQSMYICSEN